MVRCGDITRIRYGAYAPTATWEAAGARVRHLMLAAAVLKNSKTDVVLSHLSSAILHGAEVWGLPLDAVHVTRVAGGTAGRKDTGVVQHTARIDPADLVHSRDGMRHVSPVVAAAQTMSLADVDSERGLVIANSMLHQELFSKDLLRRVVESERCSPNTLTSRTVLNLADARVESVGESRTQHLFHRHGLPRLEPQVEVRDRDGRLVARLDFLIRRLGYFVEFDGTEKYTKYRRRGESVADVVVREKRREDAVRRIARLRGIRLVWADLEHPEATAAMIRQDLADHGDTPWIA